MAKGVEELDALSRLVGRRLTEEERGQLDPHLRPRRVVEGDVLIEQGRNADTMFLIEEGVLVVTVAGGHEHVEVARVRAGQWVGELALLDPGLASATVSAEQSGRVLMLSYDALRDLLQGHPALASDLLRALTRTLAARVRATSHGVLRHDAECWALNGETNAGETSWFGKLLGSIFKGDG